MDYTFHTIDAVHDRFLPKKGDHKLHRKSSDLEVIGNFFKADHYRRPKPFLFGKINTRDSLLKPHVEFSVSLSK